MQTRVPAEWLLGCPIKVSFDLVLFIFSNLQFAITTVMTSVRGW